MAHYRLYWLNSHDRIVQGADIEAADDEAACQLASTGLYGSAILEVWCGTRYVRQLPVTP
jgi:hypothetical protein